MSSATRAVAERFYQGFAARDPEAMAACYADDARCSDPVFPDLDARGARDMWRMLLGRATDLSFTLDRLDTDGDRASAAWTARYTFSATGRKVENRITSELTIAGDRIHRHRDQFDLWRWSRQALGVPGLLLGWSPLIRGKVRRTAAANLAAYQRK